jgi:hypothetical protein
MAKMTKPLNEASGLPARMRGYYETARGWLTDNVSDAAIADRVTGSASSLLSRVELTPSIPPSLRRTGLVPRAAQVTGLLASVLFWEAGWVRATLHIEETGAIPAGLSLAQLSARLVEQLLILALAHSLLALGAKWQVRCLVSANSQ